MDISVSSNFERFLFDIWGRDAAETVQHFSQLSAQRSFSVTPAVLAAARSQFASFSVDEAQTLDTIRNVFASSNYLLCPHSAVGFSAAQQFRALPVYGGEDIIVLATAHIGKFVESIASSLGSSGEDALVRDAMQSCMPTELSALVELGKQGGQRRVDVDNDSEAVKGYMRAFMTRDR